MDGQIRKEYHVVVEDKPGEVFRVARVLARAALEVESATIDCHGDAGVLRLALNGSADAREALEDAGFTVYIKEVFCFDIPRHAGALARLSEALADEEINITRLQAMSCGGRLGVILAVDQPRRAESVIGQLARAVGVAARGGGRPPETPEGRP